MAGIYIHIPFCKQACHYCDFHFSTSMKRKEEIVFALVKEIKMRSGEFLGQSVKTIYFGGGTPSVLASTEIAFLLEAIYLHYDVSDNPEITLEANPDDLSLQKLTDLRNSGINRLSIGIQSFYDDDLTMMNRAHNSQEAKISLAQASALFDNISVDLIYGIPGMSDEKWLQNIETALSFNIPHISSYALTVEPRTAYSKMIQKGQISAPDDDVAEAHFHILVKALESRGFIHYELSNFAQPGYFSQNNSAYWLGKKYIGIGPSAHSYDGKARSWNIANNALYLKAIAAGKLPSESEILSKANRFNEYIMTGLRTIWGISLSKIKEDFGPEMLDDLLKNTEKFQQQGLLEIDGDILKPTPKGKFLTDGIASDLFVI